VSFYQTKAYLHYWLDAVNKHSLHGPFIYDLYTRVITKEFDTDFTAIENLRQQVLNSNKVITVTDYGSKAEVYHGTKRKIADIAKNSLLQAAHGRLYNRLIHYFNCKQVLELGTSLGISAAYLSWHNDVKLCTIEGCAETAELASFHFEYLGLNNIKMINGPIDKKLPDYLSESGKLDFVLLDANHSYEPTMCYFEWILKKMHAKSIMVIHDIHQNKSMERAWKEIIANVQVYCTVDLFYCGLIFFDPTLSKQHHILDF
jgi:predicted O-methyltransferase YrrM